MSNAALRTNIAQAVSSLKRVRPRAPFYELPVHTVPTKWGLYRGLLRLSPTHNISWQIKTLFRRDRILTSATLATGALKRFHHLLDTLRLASDGHTHSVAVIERYDRLIAFKRKKLHWKQIEDKELKWIERMRTRPIMTGGHIPPTFYNPPLPRLKPQPEHITGMIVSRKRAWDRWQTKLEFLNSTRNDLLREAQFEDELAKLHPNLLRQRAFTQSLVQDWNEIANEQANTIHGQLAAGYDRAKMKFSPEMLAMIREARAEKIRNKTRERERERRGEILTRTIRRANKRPPTRIMRELTPEQLFEDAVSRSPSEGGFVGAIKRKLGQRLRSNTWRIEDGRAKNRKKLDEMDKEINEANARRRYLTRPALLAAELDEIAKAGPDDAPAHGSRS
ncbi:hypothetical protein AURDEDRAFT_165152 [Auricularia subglabra TFB-10046 SS5]|nr:hypothetical protein AURDEDRAFT_165152 [Auricularia subglabra TFB-10046 SS5]